MKIVVKTPFRLNINGEIKEFDAGVHDVEKSVAEHWLVKHHTGQDAEQADEPVADKAEKATEESAEATSDEATDDKPAAKKKGK
jgi:hypothetical protein